MPQSAQLDLHHIPTSSGIVPASGVPAPSRVIFLLSSHIIAQQGFLTQILKQCPAQAVSFISRQLLSAAQILTQSGFP
jgi:hypothetical protein